MTKTEIKTESESTVTKSKKIKRVPLANGRWFNEDSAMWWAEDTRWDGHNNISKATGSQWEHERLYKTKGGTFILNAWSAYHESYTIISDDDAYRWMLSQGESESIPADVLEKMEVK